MVYVNSYYVTYKTDEFYTELITDSSRHEPTAVEAHMGPTTAKGIMRALEVMVKKYEKRYGELPKPKIEQESKWKKDYTPSMHS